jgi:hypothetical protein
MIMTFAFDNLVLALHRFLPVVLAKVERCRTHFMQLKWLYNNKLKYNSEKKTPTKIVKEKTTYVAVFPLPPFPIKL